jgi:predicted RNase H-like nuclease
VSPRGGPARPTTPIGASTPAVRRALGFDGCPAGWVAVTLADGAVAHVEVVAHLRERLPEGVDGAPWVEAIAVDMPVGLVDAERDADRAARRALPGRASSVFSTPPRSVVDGWRTGEVRTHAEAVAVARRVTGKGVSQQAWRLVPKIVEVDDLVAAGVPLLEVHPEVAFAVLAGETLPRKRSWAGLSVRRALLATVGIVLPDRFVADDLAAPGDVVDAAICAWVADGAATGAPLQQLPTTTGQWAHGRPIAIHAREPQRPAQ